MAEATPFAAGRPYLRGQLGRLLTSAMFTPAAWSSALFLPPTRRKFLIRAAGAWEQAGSQVLPGFGGVMLVEAHKEIALPAAGTKSPVLKARVLKPVPGAGLRDRVAGNKAA